MVVRPLEVAGQLQALHIKSLKHAHLLLRSLSLLSPDDAFLFFRHLLRFSPPPPCDHFAYTFLLRAASPLHGLQLHARLLKSGLHDDLFVQSSLLSFYSSDPASARRVFASIARPDVTSWTALVCALARGGRDAEALAAVRAMDAPPNALTLVSALPACARLGDLRLGREAHGFGLRRCDGHGGNLILDNALLDMYMRCGDLASARSLFVQMPIKDVVSWTTLISGFAENEVAEEAMGAFCSMRRDGLVEPNEGTMASVLRACALLGGLSAGKAIHGYMLKSRIGIAAVIPGNALVNMYAKCGETGMAFGAFDGISCKDSVSWGTMMWGLAMSSRAESALQVFASMLRRGVPPDGVVFLAVLSACCHAGLVDKGMRMYASMGRVYGVAPGKEHYTCLMDALGRAGRVKEAEGLIRGMPFDADVQARGVLLSAYKLHGCHNRGEEELLGGGELSAAGGGTYALVSNILADAGRYEDSSYVRHLMGVRKVKKAVGCSKIQVL